jgi:putative FmdB family regulatory protein
MPLFEYECLGCGRQFEQLARASEPPRCPGCQGSDLRKLLSVFAVSAPGPRMAVRHVRRSARARIVLAQLSGVSDPRIPRDSPHRRSSFTAAPLSAASG